MMDKALPFAGTDEELEKYLLEFARLVGGLAGRRPAPERGWVLSAGALLSTNPNTVRWSVRIVRADEGLTLTEAVRGLPWTRSKLARIAAFRKGQLADYLTARVRGSGPERFDLARLREPFAAFGSGVAALTGSFTWAVLTGLAALAGAFVSLAAASVPLMEVVLRRIVEHSRAVEQANAVPLPSVQEALSVGLLGPAVVFAAPVAFFAGLVYAAALVASDLGFIASRAPQAAAIFVTVLIGAAFWPFLGSITIPLALLVPIGIHAAATIVWSRRREKVRDHPKPDKKIVLIAVILSASLAGAIVPRAASRNDELTNIALFRDAWLLDNSVGKAVASTYYRCTLYTAEPIKDLLARSQRTAACDDPAVSAALRRLGFVPVRGGRGPGVDVVIGEDVPKTADAAALQAALADFSRTSFRGSALRELCGCGWFSIYYAGPLVLVIVGMGAFAPALSVLFRKLQPRAALFALCAVMMGSSLLLVLFQEGPPPTPEAAEIADAMTDARAPVRHRAAVAAFRRESTKDLVDPLLKLADDPDLTVRLWACAALGKSGDPRAIPKLVERLDDPELMVRYRAAQGLGLLGDRAKAAEDALVRMMRTRSWYEGDYALAALRDIVPGKY